MLARARHKNILTTALVGTVWVTSLFFGLRALLSYETAPGAVGATPSSWPAASRIARANDRHTLVMLAHPRCPCTRASVNELAQIMAEVQAKTSAYVLFLKPEHSGTDWDDTDLERAAAKIPGVTVLADANGAEARLFGGETSGYTLLFDPAGRLVFSGGITQSRGHAGDNVGESAIVSLVRNGAAAQKSTLVFGCAMHSPIKQETPCRH